MDWHSIESAPRDRNIFIAEYHESDGKVDGDGFNEIDVGIWGYIEDSDWDRSPVYGWTSNNGRIEEPTHWAELTVPQKRTERPMTASPEKIARYQELLGKNKRTDAEECEYDHLVTEMYE